MIVLDSLALQIGAVVLILAVATAVDLLTRGHQDEVPHV